MPLVLASTCQSYANCSFLGPGLIARNLYNSVAYTVTYGLIHSNTNDPTKLPVAEFGNRYIDNEYGVAVPLLSVYGRRNARLLRQGRTDS
jgi:hypothetical protein